jgi:hypothetical protein
MSAADDVSRATMRENTFDERERRRAVSGGASAADISVVGRF